jgi:spore maturation protein SpmA
MLNAIWISFFLISFVVGLGKLIFMDEPDIFVQMMGSLFEMAKTGFEISLGLAGVMTLWLGIMRIGEKGGFLVLITRILRPLFKKLFPSIPEDHPALGSIVMNMSANALGLDNAATPLGLKAMNELQTLNPKKETASDAQILFLVLNTSSVTLFPVTIFAYRAQQGAINPADVFIPILIATFASTLIGLLAVSIYQKIDLFDRVVLGYLGSLALVVLSLVFYFSGLDKQSMQAQSAQLSNFLLFSVVVAFILAAVRKKENVYEAFIDGAKEGFQVAITIIPFLIAMLAAIGVFRASGAMDLFLDMFRRLVSAIGGDLRFVDALPTAMMKPLSGSGARGMMVDAMQTFGADSFVGRLTCVMQGSTETTLYVVALYLGSVKIRHSRYAITCGLLADGAGIIMAIFVSYLFFG